MTDPIYNPVDPKVMEDPYPTYQQLRSRCPVYHYQGAGLDYYVVTRQEDVKGVLRDPVTWSNRYGTGPLFQKSVGIFSDAPYHTAFRQVFANRLLGARANQYASQIEVFVNELVDKMLSKGSGDFHDEFAYPLPVNVMCYLLGVPTRDYDRFNRWSSEFLETAFISDEPEAFMRVFQEVADFLQGIVAERRQLLANAGVAEPAQEHLGSIIPDDLISAFMVGKIEGRYLDENEMNWGLVGVFTGGTDTTASALTNLMWRLLEVPERWQAVCADPELHRMAIEEALRHDSPAQAMWRTSLCPVSLHGVDIPAKSKLMVNYAAANRDHEVFRDAESFRLDRPIHELRNHVAFSAGPHVCPGAPVARLELATALRVLTQRMPKLRLNGPTQRIGAYNFWGRRHLPLAWD